MRKILVFLILMTMVLTGCILKKSKEAKQLLRDKKIQADIEQAIQAQIQEHYFLDVKVHIDKIKFTFPEGKLMLPMRTDKRIEVPVETLNEPKFMFKAYINIYDDETETYTFIDDEESIDIYEFKHFGSFVLEHIFKLEHKEAFLKLKDEEKTLDISINIDHEYYNRAHDDQQKLNENLRQFAKDYEAEKFVDNTYYDELMKAYAFHPNDWDPFYEEQKAAAEVCTAEIELTVNDHINEEMPSEERLESIKERVKTDPQMPKGEYIVSIHLKESPKGRMDAWERFLLCE